MHSAEDAQGTPLGFVSTQPMSPPAPRGCATQADEMQRGCRPFASLAEGGVLIVLSYGDGQGSMTSDGAPLRMSAVHAVKSCAGVGADGESTGWGHGRSASAEAFDVRISMCQRDPKAKTVAAIQKILHAAFPYTGT